MGVKGTEERGPQASQVFPRVLVILVKHSEKRLQVSRAHRRQRCLLVTQAGIPEL